MARKPIVAGNWKMNRTVEEARQLVSELVPAIRLVDEVERVLCPPATALMPISAMLVGTPIRLGAQNMHWESSGAFTGEISPAMVRELCQYVIIGHSERRAYFGETDETVSKKTQAAFAAGLTPIVCVGETLEQNEAGKTGEVVTRQLVQGLNSVERGAAAGLVIAYEPVWAIGTGRAATKEDAQRVIGEMIRPMLAYQFGDEAANGIRILYGGSVTGANAAEFFGQADIDGALVGGASLKAGDFTKIVQAAAR